MSICTKEDILDGSEVAFFDNPSSVGLVTEGVWISIAFAQGQRVLPAYTTLTHFFVPPCSLVGYLLPSHSSELAMADLEKSGVQEQHEQLDRASTKEDEHSEHKHLAPVETLVPVDIHNSQAFKGDDSDGQIHWTIRKWFAAAFLAMLYTGKELYGHHIRESLLTCNPTQAPKSSSISLEAP